MDTLAHKTTLLNHTQTMRFYPFVFTGGRATGVAARIGGGNLNHDTRCVAYDDSVVYRAEERKRKLMKNEE